MYICIYGELANANTSPSAYNMNATIFVATTQHTRLLPLQPFELSKSLCSCHASMPLNGNKASLNRESTRYIFLCQKHGIHDSHVNAMYIGVGENKWNQWLMFL